MYKSGYDTPRGEYGKRDSSGSPSRSIDDDPVARQDQIDPDSPKRPYVLNVRIVSFRVRLVLLNLTSEIYWVIDIISPTITKHIDMSSIVERNTPFSWRNINTKVVLLDNL